MSLELAGLVSSFTTLNAITKATIGLRDAVKLNDKIVEFQQAMIEANGHVLSVQQEYFSMTAEVQKLKDENVRLKNWATEKEKYVLRQIGDGVFAYVEKQFMGDFESAQKFCSNCFDQEIKSLLQGEKIKVGRRVATNCHRCGARDEFDYWMTYPPPKPLDPAAPINYTG